MEAKLGAVETRFAQIVWQNAPLTTVELVKLCANELNWKRTTTYTVLKKLCDRGIFQTKDSLVTVLVSESAYATMKSEQFVAEHFGGSLPAFLAAFTAGKTPPAHELNELRKIIDSLAVVGNTCA